MIDSLFSTPRPVPGRLAPALAGGTVVLLALPVFLVAGWPLAGWGLAAVLWAAGQVLALLLTRVLDGAGNLGAGVAGVGMTFRAIAVGVPLVAVTVANPEVGIAAAVVYALAFTLELAVGLVAYFGSEARA